VGLTGHCVGTIVGEGTIYAFSSAICLYWIEGVEAAVVVVLFYASFEHTMNKINFAV
jgi:hypothetical protein